MNKTRLEAFSDGVLAIIITIMVLEIKVPHDASLDALMELLPVFLSYLLSFAFVAIYWVNHHHLLHCIKKVNSKIMWSNISLLFTLSLVPFSTGWMGENHYAPIPTTLYCINLLFCGFAAGLLQTAIASGLPPQNKIFTVMKQNLKKTIISVILYIVSIILSFWFPFASLFLIGVVAVMWVVPDKRIEELMEKE